MTKIEKTDAETTKIEMRVGIMIMNRVIDRIEMEEETQIHQMMMMVLMMMAGDTYIG